MTTIEIAATQELERYLIQGRDAGCPADQMRSFVRAGYIALPWQLQFHALARQADTPGGPDRIGLGGARGPGKSYAVLAQTGIDDCHRYDGLKALFLRKIQKTAQESFDDLIRKVLAHLSYSYRRGQITFPNGSRILVGGFKDASEIEKYIGIEYDLIAIEEATTLEESRRQMLLGSLRTSRDDWRPRLYESTNPGGIGHLWFKETYVIPYREGTEDERHRFIPATYKDNPFLDEGYINYLENLPGQLGKAWREGDFDSFQGMAFPDWKEAVHVINPFVVPDHWPKWRSVDWGFAAPFCCLWFAKDPDSGRVYVYRELYQPGLTDQHQARAIKELTPPNESISITYADPSMWTSKSALGIITSTADEYQREGVILTRADNDRLSGKRKIHRLLTNLPDGKPGLLVFGNCKNLRRTMPALPLDDHNPEDVDTDAEDHAYDALRYGATNLDVMRERVKPQPSPMAQIRGL